MGAVHVTLDLENTTDADRADEGMIASTAVRRVSVRALVDPAQVLLVLPQDIAEHLGLLPRETGLVKCAGPVTVRTSSRAGIFECLVAPPGAEAVFGRIPLSRLDLHVDPVQQQLVVRPESPIYPLYSVK